MEKGQINVQSENIFPIIKKFLYSDHDIFLRELVSNAVDATQKLKKLASMGEAKGELGNIQIDVILDKTAKTIRIFDRGIGMTHEEIKKYINQIAFSSAEEFIEKFKDTDGTSIIGHFGLGFYSAFMVSDKVEIFSKSYKENTEAVHWTCDGSPNFELTHFDKTDRGTEIVLHINSESEAFLDKSRLSELLQKYCKFLPVPIRLGEADEFEDLEKLVKLEPINDTEPAWSKKPADLKNEDYQNFYKKLYPFSEPPLFWIHLNVDYPFLLTGILYFPKLQQGFELQKNKIQLYSNQVFVTDSVENIVPEFLMHLHGVIDSPDIPLNVSRSYLQADSNVKKINTYISKKVADKLHDLFKDNRKDFEVKWDDIGVFVKYGILSDEKFKEKAKSFVLLKNTENEFFTIEEYRNKIKESQTDKNDTLVVLYATQAEEQHAFIETAKSKGYDVLLLDNVLDSHFINHLEGAEEKLTFKRVDADTIDLLIEKAEAPADTLSEEDKKKLEEEFKGFIQNDKISIQIKSLDEKAAPAIITRPEFMRRFSDMQAVSGQRGMMPEVLNLVINGNHPLIKKIISNTNIEQKNAQIGQVYDLALLSQGMLKGDKLTRFIQRSVSLID